jgi:hypothetical protein
MAKTFAVDEDSNIFAKAPEIIDQWAKLKRRNPRLVSLVTDFATEFMRPKGYPAVITSIYRPDDGGIHADWRAVDVRSTLMPHDSAEEIRVAFNAKHPYGLKHDGTPGETIPPLDHKAAQATTQSNASHFHLQIRG